MKDPLQQSYRNRNIALDSEALIESSILLHFLSLAEINQLLRIDYSDVSQIVKRFEQESKLNHKIGEIK